MAAAETAARVELLRFIASGSVDDGKSTLIGRLLHDSKSLFEDQLAAVKAAGNGALNLAFLTDGLKEERAKGITIDVAYRYFATPRRRFIIADCPGHFELTRNMVTGASTAGLALLLVDASQGLKDQTRRHALIASLLRIPHIVVCVNKMDLVGFRREAFDAIRRDFMDFGAKLEAPDIRFVPISALAGDNVVARSRRMPWYEGSTLLYLLEDVPVDPDHNLIDCRFPIQSVVKEPGRAPLCLGRLAGGVLRRGDRVVALPSGRRAKVASIETYGGRLKEAFAPQSIAVALGKDLGLKRGDMLVREHNVPAKSRDIEAMLCWLAGHRLRLGGRYLLRHAASEVPCTVADLRYQLDVRTLHRRQGVRTLGSNDIGRALLRAERPLFFDSYRRNKATGCLVLVDPQSGQTLAGGMIL